MKLSGLESLRGAAALYVLLHHAAVLNGWPVPLGLVFRFGQEAVIAFFLISGFVIALAQERTTEPGFGAYLRRRAFRIYPVFLMALALAFVFAPSLPHAVRTDLPTLVGNLLQLQDLSQLKPGVAFEVFGGNDPLWSLSYEWWFYLFFYGLWRWRPDRTRDRDVTVAGAAGVIVFALAPNPIALFLAYFPLWWAGARLAHLHLSGGPVQWRAFSPLAIVAALWGGVAAAAAMKGTELSIGHYPLLPLRHSVVALGAVGVALTLRAWRVDWMARGWAPLTAFAGVSYAVYVLHYPVLASGWFAGLPHVVRLPVQCALVLGLAVVAERLVQPWLQRLSLRTDRGAAPSLTRRHRASSCAGEAPQRATTTSAGHQKMRR
jgi:peptidoglycan/LPS O-acetylase OafA/YrhL